MHNEQNFFFNIKNHKHLGIILLTISFCIGIATLRWQQFTDEGDNLVVGNLLVQGYTLYKDIFSHHFPFPYYWTAIIISLFGKSIFFARLSVLMFQIAVFAITMKLSRNHLLVGTTALLWGVVRLFYRGHMVLYSSFTGVSLYAVLLITLSILQQNISPDWRHWLTIGILSTISFLSDPLSVYAIIVSIIFLFIKKPIYGLAVSVVTIGGITLYAGQLFITDSLHAFLNNAVLFNSQIYAKYNYTNPVRIHELYNIIIQGLEIANSVWWNFIPLKPIPSGYTELDQWIFTGFLYRFSLIICVVSLVLRKQLHAASFLYLFTAAALVINKWDFRSQPFIIAALTAISAIVINEWQWETVNQSLKLLQKGIRLIVTVMVFWLILQLGAYIYLNWHNRSYTAGFASFEKEAASLQELTCHRSDVLLAYYPEGNYWYWFADLKPVSKYVFMWPWVAEVGLNDVISELDRQEFVIVVLKDANVWGLYDTKEYLSPLYEFLEANYHKVKEGIYISPKLFTSCPN